MSQLLSSTCVISEIFSTLDFTVYLCWVQWHHCRELFYTRLRCIFVQCAVGCEESEALQYTLLHWPSLYIFAVCSYICKYSGAPASGSCTLITAGGNTALCRSRCCLFLRLPARPGKALSENAFPCTGIQIGSLVCPAKRHAFRWGVRAKIWPPIPKPKLCPFQKLLCILISKFEY